MTDRSDPLVGRLLGGRYRIVRPLAAGGMGAVYEAVQEALQREVAIKVVRPGLVDDEFRKRFELEAIATSRLRDPNVVTVHDFGIDDALSLPFLVFEKLEGRDLAAEIDVRGRMEWLRAVRVLKGITSALVAAHQVGIVHRDLKPSNVFLVDTPTGGGDFVKVIDFGIAKILNQAGIDVDALASERARINVQTSDGFVSGSPGFIAPERMSGAGGVDDVRSDLYALGAIAFELLSGRPPFVEKSALALAIKHLHQEAPRLRDAGVDVPPRLDELVHSLLQKSAARRPKSAADVLRELDIIAVSALEHSTDLAPDLPTGTGTGAANPWGVLDPRLVRAPDRGGDDNPGVVDVPEEPRGGPGSSGFARVLADLARVPPSQPLVEGAAFGRYVLERELGRGGMGVVWRARDEKLGRDVALKVLPAAFADDPERLRRFRREGKAAAALTHPCIATVLDVDEHDGVAFIAMELVEGRTLRSLLRERKRLNRQDALAIGRDVASGLARAHAAGIVHRDVKPENVMVTVEGRAKLLDFGIAQMHRQATRPGGDESSPLDGGALAVSVALGDDQASALTSHGAFLGTPAYVSPEQAEGGRVDARSDIFSFGALLHEMLSGAPAFAGTSAASILAAVLKDDPRPVRGGRLSPVVRRCLEKNPARRYADGSALLAAVEAAARPRGNLVAVGVAAAALLVAAAVGAAGVAGVASVSRWAGIGGNARPDGDGVSDPVSDGARAARARRSNSAEPLRRLTDTPGVERDPALSADGKALVFSAIGEGERDDLFLLPLGDRREARPINLTKSAGRSERNAAFSPDGTTIVFVEQRPAGDAIWMMNVKDVVKDVAPVEATLLVDGGASPAFSADGREVFYATEGFDLPEAVSLRRGSSIRSANVATGKTRAIFEERDCFSPAPSPDGARLAFWCIHDGRRDIYTLALDAAPGPAGSATGSAAVSVTADDAVDYNPSWSVDGDTLFFLSDQSGTMTLWSVGIDETGRASGEPAPVVAGAVSMRAATIGGGRIVYRTEATMSAIEKRALDVATAHVGPPVRAFESGRLLRAIDVSPDGRWLVVESFSQQNDLLLVASDGSMSRALTDDAAFDRGPRFFPDGKRIAFASNRGGAYGIWTLALHTEGDGQLVEVEEVAAPVALPGARCAAVAPALSPNGRRLAAGQLECGSRIALYDLSADGNGNGGADATGAGAAATPPPADLPLAAGSMALPMAWLDDSRLVALRVGSGFSIVDVRSGASVDRNVAVGAVAALPDGRLIAFHGRQLVVIDVDDTVIRGVTTGDQGPAPFEIGPSIAEAAFAVSADGRTLWMTTVRVESDLWLASAPHP